MLDFLYLLTLLITQLSVTEKMMLVAGVIVYNAYIDGLMKRKNFHKAEEVYQNMKKDRCQPSNETYTMIINLYGRVDCFICIPNCFWVKFVEFRLMWLTIFLCPL